MLMFLPRLQRFNVRDATPRGRHFRTWQVRSSTLRPHVAYDHSFHAQAIHNGTKAATCLDCHTKNGDMTTILPAGDPKSTINRANIAETCGRCHGDQSVMQGSGITNQPYLSYRESVHSQAIARGNTRAAVCTDCHNSHDIRAASDAESSISKVNVPRTCGKCHESEANEFTVSIHGQAVARGVSRAPVCTDCHGIHNIKMAFEQNTGSTSVAVGTESCAKCHEGVALTQEFGVAGERVSSYQASYHGLASKLGSKHWLLLTSFLVLVFSGFALQYPDSWVAWLLDGNESLRRIIHRVAAVVMLLVGTYHVLYLALSKEGRLWVRDMLPKLKDVKDVIGNFGYYLGVKKEKPKIARFGYAEKAEYWAVVWGTIIMGLTGLMIWFKIGVFGFLPRWWVDIALAVHFYEAVLATLAIIVWHFYQVIFDPDVYPVNFAFIDGRVSEESYKEEHELAYEQMKEQAAHEEVTTEEATLDKGAPD